MSNQFLKLRRSAIPGKIPETSSLDLGELAMNTHDGLLFMKKSSSFGEEIIPIGVSTTSGSFTGSFSGSFTGSLEGTASFALSASWVPKTIPGGSNYQIQFNSGSEFSGSPELIWNYNSSSLAHGDSVVASGMYSHAEGSLTVASGDYSHAEGVETIASGSYSHAEGSLTVASGDYSHAEGELSIASGNRSHAEGESTTASGINSHAEGAGTSAEGAISHAEGYSTIARGQVSHAEGSLTVASGDYSHAEGVETIASGSYSHSEGYYAQAEGYGSHAEGYDSIASGSFSHAEGYSTKAYGESSHSEGNNTEASGEISHAEGLDTIASGVASHAEGDATIALGYASHAEGCATIAAAPYQHVQGKYNVTSSIESAFIVGNGTNNDDRSNLIFAAENQVIISGSVISNYGFTGSLQGTASFAVSASWAPTAETDPIFSAWLLTSPLSGYVPTSRSINISGVTQDLSANRTWLFDYQQNTTPTGTGTSSIIVGAKWFHTDSGRIYEYVYDGDTYQWVSPTLPTATGATGAAGPNNIDTSTTTPINGVLKGNGSTVAQAVAGTDYQAPIGYTPENQANKENTTLDNSSTKYPTNNLVKTNLDNFSDDVDYVIMINQRILFNY